MNKELQEAIQIVRDLNDQLFNNLGEDSDYPEFYVLSNGFDFIIKFQDLHLYSSVDDERKFDEEKNEYEPLDEFIQKQTAASIRDLNSVLLQVVGEGETDGK